MIDIDWEIKCQKDRGTDSISRIGLIPTWEATTSYRDYQAYQSSLLTLNLHRDLSPHQIDWSEGWVNVAVPIIGARKRSS